MVLKNIFFIKNGIRNFKKSKNSLLENLETNLVFKFRVNRMEITACKLCDEQTNNKVNKPTKLYLTIHHSQ